jgi:hypothetical protein
MEWRWKESSTQCAGAFRVASYSAGRSVTLELPFQIVEVHDKGVRPLTGQRSEKVSPVHTAIRAAFSWETSLARTSGQRPRVVDRANSSGERRKAEKTSSGNSNVTLGILASCRGVGFFHS